MTGRKTIRVVFDEIIEEEIEFRGEKILRERIKKVWKIPKMINDDISFQLIFGADPPTPYNNFKMKINEVSIDKISYKTNY